MSCSNYETTRRTLVLRQKPVLTLSASQYNNDNDNDNERPILRMFSLGQTRKPKNLSHCPLSVTNHCLNLILLIFVAVSTSRWI